MKKIIFIVLLLAIIIMNVVIISYTYLKEDKTTIKDNYVAVFKGETGEIAKSTYVYRVTKKKKGKKIITYKYTNTTSTINGYDSTNWKEEVTKKGKVKKLKDLYKVAEKNEAYSYVKYMEDGEIYSIEDFKKIFK